MQNQMDKTDRLDHSYILDFVDEGSKVLDLGCGDGALLSLLIEHKNCQGTGIEIDEKAIYKCVENGISVTHDDIDSGLSDYSNKRFDYVILNESLQQILKPKKVILDSFRVGKKVIVGIPNFAHISSRLQIFFQGLAPITQELPFEWYDTPNLRFLSIRDFRHFCRDNNIKILQERGIYNNKPVHFKRNLFANVSLYLLEK